MATSDNNKFTVGVELKAIPTNTIAGSGPYNAVSGHTIVSTDSSGIVPYQFNTPKCEHLIADETEMDDGQIVAFCCHCGDKILGRRMVGGLGLAKLKHALVDALGDADAMADLLDEVDRVEHMLRVEELALKSAHEMLDMARTMIRTIVLPEKESGSEDV